MKISKLHRERVVETAPLQLHSLFNIIIVDIARPLLFRAHRESSVALIRASKFRCTSCMQQGVKINMIFNLIVIFMETPFENPVILWNCLPAFLHAPSLVASQFPCIMPPHCCRFRFQIKFRMTTFGETALSRCPKSFQVTIINLGSFFSHAIPLFFLLPPLTSDFSLEPLEIKAAPHFIFAPKKMNGLKSQSTPNLLSPPCLEIAIRSF